jgi:hypothetical protein
MVMAVPMAPTTTTSTEVQPNTRATPAAIVPPAVATPAVAVTVPPPVHLFRSRLAYTALQASQSAGGGGGRCRRYSEAHGKARSHYR